MCPLASVLQLVLVLNQLALGNRVPALGSISSSLSKHHLSLEVVSNNNNNPHCLEEVLRQDLETRHQQDLDKRVHLDKIMLRKGLTNLLNRQGCLEANNSNLQLEDYLETLRHNNQRQEEASLVNNKINNSLSEAEVAFSATHRLNSSPLQEAFSETLRLSSLRHPHFLAVRLNKITHLQVEDFSGRTLRLKTQVADFLEAVSKTILRKPHYLAEHLQVQLQVLAVEACLEILKLLSQLEGYLEEEIQLKPTREVGYLVLNQHSKIQGHSSEIITLNRLEVAFSEEISQQQQPQPEVSLETLNSSKLNHKAVSLEQAETQVVAPSLVAIPILKLTQVEVYSAILLNNLNRPVAYSETIKPLHPLEEAEASLVTTPTSLQVVGCSTILSPSRISPALAQFNKPQTLVFSEHLISRCRSQTSMIVA